MSVMCSGGISDIVCGVLVLGVSMMVLVVVMFECVMVKLVLIVLNSLVFYVLIGWLNGMGVIVLGSVWVSVVDLVWVGLSSRWCMLVLVSCVVSCVGYVLVFVY